MPKTAISLRLDQDLLSAARNHAHHTHTTVSSVITQALLAYLHPPTHKPLIPPPSRTPIRPHYEAGYSPPEED